MATIVGVMCHLVYEAIQADVLGVGQVLRDLKRIMAIPPDTVYRCAAGGLRVL